MINQTFMVTRKHNMPLPITNTQDFSDTCIREISIADAEGSIEPDRLNFGNGQPQP